MAVRSSLISRTAPITTLAGAAETTDDLVGDDQHLVLATHLLAALPIVGGRHDHIASADHRLGDEGGNGVGAFAHDECFKFHGQALGELRFALAWSAMAITMRSAHMKESGQRQIEAAVHARKPREAGAQGGDALIAVQAADDLLALWLADGVVAIPDQLDQHIVGFGPRVAEVHLAQGTCASSIRRSARAMLQGCDLCPNV